MKRASCLFFILAFAIAVYAQQKSLETYFTEAQALQQDGKSQEAVDLLKEAIETYPNESKAHLQLGLAWGALGQQSGETGDFNTAMMAVNEGFSAFEKAIALEPDHYDAHFYYGVYGVSVPSLFGKLDAGVDYLEKALAILKKQSGTDTSDREAAVYRYLGVGYQTQGKFDKARSVWEKVLELSPEGELAEAARIGLAGLEKAVEMAKTLEARKKQDSPKIISLKEKLSQSPEDFELNYSLGRAYFDIGRWIEAQEALKKAVSLNKNHFDARHLLVRALSEDGMLAYDERIYEDQSRLTNLAFEIVEQTKRLMDIDPTNVRARMEYAVLCVMMPFFVQRIDEGLTLLDTIAKDETLPDSVRAEALYHLGFGYRKKGNALWMKLIKDYPQAQDAQGVYDEFGLRWSGRVQSASSSGKVLVNFHLGFQDELAPQTGVWVEDANGQFVKTLYVSGFSGYAREKQVNLPQWAHSSRFETDGTTGASIDWGKHTYAWDLTDHEGNRVPEGTYRVHVEVCWWPSMQYGTATADIQVGKTGNEVTVDKAPHIPWLHVAYQL